MTNPDMDQDTITEYTLGVLPEARALEVEAYLRAHPELAAQVRAEREALAQMALDLPLDLPEARVPDGAEDRLMARLRAERQAGSPAQASPAPANTPIGAPVAGPPGARRAAPWWLAGVAVAAVLAGLLVVPRLPDWQASRTLNSYRSQPGAVDQILKAADGGRLGELVRLPDGRLFVLMDQAPQAGRVYQSWRIQGQSVRPMGTFGGRAYTSQDPFESGVVFGLTQEAPGGSQTPTPPVLTTAKL
jgi:Anti-sigma-K factor rskA